MSVRQRFLTVREIAEQKRVVEAIERRVRVELEVRMASRVGDWIWAELERGRPVAEIKRELLAMVDELAAMSDG